MKNPKVFQLKKPVLVWIVGCCYLIAGPATLIQIAVFEHIAKWYDPSVWLNIFAQMSFLDQAVCAAAPVAGMSLLIQRKRSWVLAIAVLLGALVQNIYCIVSGEELLYPIAIPMIANSAVLIVFYYFRFPYLDRRDRIFSGLTKRYPIEMPVTIDQHKGVLAKSISTAGCNLVFTPKQKLPDVNSTVQFQIDGISFEGTIRYHHKETVGVRFIFPRRLSRSKLRQILNHSEAANKPARKVS
jgi:hypothetical protein